MSSLHFQTFKIRGVSHQRYKSEPLAFFSCFLQNFCRKLIKDLCGRKWVIFDRVESNLSFGLICIWSPCESSLERLSLLRESFLVAYQCNWTILRSSLYRMEKMTDHTRYWHYFSSLICDFTVGHMGQVSVWNDWETDRLIQAQLGFLCCRWFPVYW